ncbi:MAG: hypothetical protein KBA61_02055 [Spirochaetes bacterium]|nr:hypothetical protein [Spirochaetota bacterium]
MVAREKAFRIVVCAALMFGAAAMTACDDGGDPNFWGKTYDYTDAGQEILAMAPVSGGYVVAGTVSVYAGGMSDMGDLWIAKLDSEGQVEWQNIIHGAKMEIGIDNMSVIQTADGGYAVTCRSNSFTDDFAPLVVRLDAAGNILWQRAFAQDVFHTHVVLLKQTSDGGFIMLSSQLTKLDAFGNVQWTQSYGYAGGGDFELMALEIAPDGGYVMAGRLVDSHYLGYFDGIVLKVDASGILQWNTEFGSANVFTELYAVRAVQGGYLAAGAVSPAGSMARDFLIVMFDANGNILWKKRFDLKGDQEEMRSIDIAHDGACVVAGSTNGYDQSDIVIAKIKLTGAVDWIKKYDAEASVAREIRRTQLGYAVAGYNGLGLLVSVDKNGAIPNAGSRIQAMTPSVTSPAFSTGHKALVAENPTIGTMAATVEMRSLGLTVKDL